MNSMQSLTAVNPTADGIIGKFFYYSTSRLLIPKQKFMELGMSFGFSKYKPAKESKAGSYRNATSALRDRMVVRDRNTTHIYQIYCRDNKKEDERYIVRELVKETQNSRTNEYTKLANVVFDKENESVYSEDEIIDPDVDVQQLCDKTQELYQLYCDCYTGNQIESVIQDQLDRMQANKISIHGNLYFVPCTDLQRLDLLENYMSALGEHNLNGGPIIYNSMFVVNDEQQRQKMTEEFYANYKRDLEFYQQRIQTFIDNGCDSKAVIERWIQKINELQKKKQVYEGVLKQQLDQLDSDFALLTMQANELQVRNVKGQMTIPLVA